jgi:hypothetical protein
MVAVEEVKSPVYNNLLVLTYCRLERSLLLASSTSSEHIRGYVKPLIDLLVPNKNTRLILYRTKNWNHGSKTAASPVVEETDQL